MNRLTQTLAIVLLVAAPAFAGGSPAPFFFDNVLEFNSFNLGDGKFLKGTEDFEESVIPQGAKQAFPAPLQAGVSNVAFPAGIAADNLIIQDNLDPGPAPATLNPSGNSSALFASGAGFAGGNSVKIGEDMGILNHTHVSIDLIFLPTDGIKTGVGFDISRYDQYPGASGWVVSVFDIDDNYLGQTAIPEPSAAEPNKMFFGVWADSIGRINIADTAEFVPEGIDNIQMWVPEPSTVSLLLLSAIPLRRRRRRH